MNILITGSSGFLGNELYESLINSHSVMTLSRTGLSNYNLNLATTVPNFESKLDLIIHAAGKAHSIPKNKNEENEFFQINTQGTRNLLSGLSKMNQLPSKLVFISTVSVYGLTEGLLIDEDEPLNSLDPYGLSKIYAERLVQDWCINNNVKLTIFRLPLVIGKNAPGNLRSMINGIRSGYYFNINGGNAKKSMVLSKDISKYILIAAEIGGIFNLTDGYHPTFFELSHYIGSQFGKKSIPSLPNYIAKYFAKFGDIYGHNFPLNTVQLLKINSTLTFNDEKARLIFGWDPSPIIGNFII